MTLVELVLAMVGVSLVALTVTAMLFAVTEGSDEDKSVRSLAVEAKSISTRLNAAIRGSRRLLSLSDTRAILWSADTDADGLADLDELRILTHNPDLDRLTSSLVSDAAPPAEYDALATTFGDVVDDLDAAGLLVGTTWSNRVGTLDIATDNADDLQGASLVQFTITLQRGDMTETVVYAAALRNRGDSGS